jgi:hypothetical protein
VCYNNTQALPDLFVNQTRLLNEITYEWKFISPYSCSLAEQYGPFVGLVGVAVTEVSVCVGVWVVQAGDGCYAFRWRLSTRVRLIWHRCVVLLFVSVFLSMSCFVASSLLSFLS